MGSFPSAHGLSSSAWVTSFSHAADELSQGGKQDRGRVQTEVGRKEAGSGAGCDREGRGVKSPSWL